MFRDIFSQKQLLLLLIVSSLQGKERLHHEMPETTLYCAAVLLIGFEFCCPEILLAHPVCAVLYVLCAVWRRFYPPNGKNGKFVFL